jgi:hypothetical protein
MTHLGAEVVALRRVAQPSDLVFRILNLGSSRKGAGLDVASEVS